MTKAVRIENADTSDYQVLVQVYDKAPLGIDSPDTLVKEILLAHPTAMTGADVYITDTRYLVIKEVKKQ
jgi:hypothetical protein